jgi:hypothetical protein
MEPVAPQPPLSLRHARDITMFWSFNRTTALEATLTGQVVRRNPL